MKLNILFISVLALTGAFSLAPSVTHAFSVRPETLENESTESLCIDVNLNRLACNEKPATPQEADKIAAGPCWDIGVQLVQVPEEKPGFLAKLMRYFSSKDLRLPDDYEHHVGEYYPTLIDSGKPTWCATELTNIRTCLKKWNSGWISTCGSVNTETLSHNYTAKCCDTCSAELNQFEACLNIVPHYQQGQYFNSGYAPTSASPTAQKNISEPGAASAPATSTKSGSAH